MTPREAMKILNRMKNQITMILLYILDLNGEPYYKLLFSNSEDKFDITIVTNQNHGYYKLMMVCQEKGNKNIFGTKMIFAEKSVLKMLKTVHLYYISKFEKHIKHYDLIKDVNCDSLNDIRDILIDEAKIIRGPINELDDFDQTLNRDLIISYQLDKFLLPGLSTNVIDFFKESLLTFCTSIGGENYWSSYTFRSKNINVNSIQTSIDEARFRRNPHQFYFKDDEIDKAKQIDQSIVVNGNTVEIILDSQLYILWYRYDESSIGICFEFNLVHNDIVYNLIKADRISSVYERISSSESRAISNYCIFRFKPKNISSDTIVYLMRLALVHMVINPDFARLFSKMKGDHPVISVYKGVTNDFHQKSSDNWIYEKNLVIYN